MALKSASAFPKKPLTQLPLKGPLFSSIASLQPVPTTAGRSPTASLTLPEARGPLRASQWLTGLSCPKCFDGSRILSTVNSGYGQISLEIGCLLVVGQ